MLKQGVVQEALGDLNPMAPLPPLNNLPQWSRINTLDKARYPKPFLKDRYQPLPQATDPAGTDSIESGEDHDHEIGDKMNPAQRIQHLEKSLLFLRTQHQEILANLHEEIDKLKRENKELQFRLVMLQRNSSPSEASSPTKATSDQAVHIQPSPSTSAKKKERKQRSASKSGSNSAKVASAHSAKAHSANIVSHSHIHEDNQDQQSEQQSQASDEKLDELKIIFLEEEIKELKKTLREEHARNAYLAGMLEQAEKQNRARMSQSQVGLPGHFVPRPPSGPRPHAENQGTKVVAKFVSSAELPYGATVEPFQVHLASQPARPPNVAECEVIIKYLHQLNDKQAHELNQLKSDLRDVLYSHKWTPDAYLLAKAYIAEDDAKEEAEHNRFPRIQLKQPSRKLPDLAYVPRDTVTLPALKQTMGNKAVERRKRTQILQKSRLKREMKPFLLESEEKMEEPVMSNIPKTVGQNT